jgi:hypothetical protein
MPEEPGVRDMLWRLGREAALVWRMVQVAQELERQAPAVEALGDAPEG